MSDTTIRTLAVLAILATLLVAPAAARASDFMATSYLIAPRQAGEFVLAGADHDPQRPQAGVNFRYVLPDQPAVDLSLLMVKAGPVDPAPGVADVVEDILGDFKYLVESGNVQAMETLDRTPFDVEHRLDGTGAVADDASPPVMTVKARGERLRAGITSANGGEFRSNVHVVIKQMYFLILRTMGPPTLSQEAFDAVTDDAARTLALATEAAHVGHCSRHSQLPPLPAGASAKEVESRGVSTAALRMAFNCHSSAATIGLEELRRNAEVVVVEHPSR